MNKPNDQAQIVNRLEKCETWLENCSLEDVDEGCDYTTDDSSSVVTESTESSASAMSSGSLLFNDSMPKENSMIRSDQPVELQSVTGHTKHRNKFNCKIYKSKVGEVHFGDVTNINGTVVVSNVYAGPRVKEFKPALELEETKSFKVVDRINWLAQPPVAKLESIQMPAQYVIICHTATEEGFTQSDNTLLVRLTQMFHVECRKWDDISYNFLIGSDGNVYEGRGWNVEGSHTFQYNRYSVGIAFVGCFRDHLPPEVSLNRCRNLIMYGVKTGAIAEDYILLGHCQCVPTASPGEKLFEELKTWEHWSGEISPINPIPEVWEMERS